MKREVIVNTFWIAFGISTVVLGLYKIENYFSARIAYEEIACSSNAYIVYKGYDDQTEDIKTQDWLGRVSDCAKVQAEYQSGF